MSEGETSYEPGQSPGAKVAVPEVRGGAAINKEGHGMLALKGPAESLMRVLRSLVEKHGNASVNEVVRKEVGSGEEPSKN